MTNIPDELNILNKEQLQGYARHNLSKSKPHCCKIYFASESNICPGRNRLVGLLVTSDQSGVRPCDVKQIMCAHIFLSLQITI